MTSSIFAVPPKNGFLKDLNIVIVEQNFLSHIFKKIFHIYLVCHKVTASVILTGGNLEVVSLEPGTRQGYLLSPQLFNDCS